MSSKMNHPKYNIVWIIKFVDFKSTNLTTNIFCRFEIDSDLKINWRETFVDLKSTKVSTRQICRFEIDKTHVEIR
jgi:hypothetical protein